MEDNAEKMKIEAKKTGTTTVGIVCKDGVVLASDRRATMGYFIASKDIDKVYPIADTIGMTIAGSVGDAQQLIRWMKAELKMYQLRNGRKASVEAATTLLANILIQYKFYPFFVQLLVGGVDEDGPRLFSVDMLGGITEEKMISTGSGSPIAMGVIEDRFAEDKPIEDNLKIAARAVTMAMRRDAGSGERVDLVVITKDGFKRIPKEEVKKFI